MMLDTDVMVWYLRGNPKAKTFIDNLSHGNLSAVVYMELLQGMKNKKELIHFKQFMHARNFKVIPIDPEITSRAVYLLEKYNLSHGINMPDALIAATADSYGETLYTGNMSHYKMIPSISVKRFIH